MDELPEAWRPDCRRFDGYRPCAPGRVCRDCREADPVEEEILVIALEALGAVLRTTAQLPALRARHPRARISWLTRPRAVPLLHGHPLIDRVLPLDLDALCELPARRFDLLLCADKGRAAAGFAMQVPAAERRGFGLDARGAVVPLNPGAELLYRTGLDDALKFRENELSEPAMLAMAFALPVPAEPYRLHLAPEERRDPLRPFGLNTGSSPAWPRKTLAFELQVELVRRLAEAAGEPVLLLGGPEDAERVQRLSEALGPLAEPSPCDLGLRAGAAEVARCEVVVTGDSLGLHLAVALGCHVAAWFGPTCPQEIELYERGLRVLADVGCAPCWQPGCRREPACNAALDPGLLAEAALDCLEARRAGRPIDGFRGRPWGPCAR